jgi:hypothetical protein
MEQQLIVGGGVKAANVDIAITRDSVLETLFKALHVTCRRKDRGYCLWNTRVLDQELIQHTIRDRRRLWLVRSLSVVGNHKLVR